jgi:hypothetical protein
MYHSRLYTFRNELVRHPASSVRCDARYYDCIYAKVFMVRGGRLSDHANFMALLRITITSSESGPLFTARVLVALGNPLKLASEHTKYMSRL